MAGARVNNYSPSTTDLTSVMGTLDGTRTGYISLSLTEYDSTARPGIAGGSLVEVAGALFRFSTTEAISTTGVTSTAAQMYYIRLVPTSSQCSAQFSTTASAWREDLQGYYHSTTSNDRIIGYTCFTGADYVTKNIYIARDYPTPALFYAREEQAAGTHGGTFTTGAWRTRVINTIVTNEIEASLSTNQITLHPGTYDVYATAPAKSVASHQAILFNVSSTTTALVGTNEYAHAGSEVNNRSIVAGRIDISTTTIYELRHYSSLTKSTDGFGVGINFGEVNIYSEIKITTPKRP